MTPDRREENRIHMRKNEARYPYRVSQSKANNSSEKYKSKYQPAAKAEIHKQVWSEINLLLGGAESLRQNKNEDRSLWTMYRKGFLRREPKCPRSGA